MSWTRAISTTSRHELSSSLFFLQGKAPKEIHAILTETLACFLPGRAKDLSAPLYRLCMNMYITSYVCVYIMYVYIFVYSKLYSFSPVCFTRNPFPLCFSYTVHMLIGRPSQYACLPHSLSDVNSTSIVVLKFRTKSV